MDSISCSSVAFFRSIASLDWRIMNIYPNFGEIKKDQCFGCGKEGFFILYSPMRCYDCVKNGIPVSTSPVSDAYFEISDKEKTNVSNDLSNQQRKNKS